MKIYRNPEGKLTLLFPSLFLGSIPLILFLISRTIITVDWLKMFLAFSFFACFLVYFLLAKKWKLFPLNRFNLLLALSLTTSVLAFILLFNFTISFTIYQKKIAIDKKFYQYYSENEGYIYEENVPSGCYKFFKVYEPQNLKNQNFVFMKVDQGILGFKVLKHKIFSEEY